jgi:hypothetical protein
MNGSYNGLSLICKQARASEMKSSIDHIRERYHAEKQTNANSA